MAPDDLETRSFGDRDELREWLAAHHATSPGLWVRLFRARPGTVSARNERLAADLVADGLMTDAGLRALGR